jgi:hypothetical protein
MPLPLPARLGGKPPVARPERPDSESAPPGPDKSLGLFPRSERVRDPRWTHSGKGRSRQVTDLAGACGLPYFATLPLSGCVPPYGGSPYSGEGVGFGGTARVQRLLGS